MNHTSLEGDIFRQSLLFMQLFDYSSVLILSNTLNAGLLFLAILHPCIATYA